MGDTILQIQIDEQTRQKIEDIKTYLGLNYNDADVIMHAVDSLYWECAPDDVRTDLVLGMRHDLRAFIHHGLDNLARFRAGETVPGLEELDPLQIDSIKSWLATSLSNMDIIEILAAGQQAAKQTVK